MITALGSEQYLSIYIDLQDCIQPNEWIWYLYINMYKFYCKWFYHKVRLGLSDVNVSVEIVLIICGICASRLWALSSLYLSDVNYVLTLST